MPERPVPQPRARSTDRNVPSAEVGQQHLALLLRYAIDKGSVEAVRVLFDENPVNIRSRHVAHNMGKTRAAWLREKGFNLDG